MLEIHGSNFLRECKTGGRRGAEGEQLLRITAANSMCCSDISDINSVPESSELPTEMAFQGVLMTKRGRNTYFILRFTIKVVSDRDKTLIINLHCHSNVWNCIESSHQNDF